MSDGSNPVTARSQIGTAQTSRERTALSCWEEEGGGPVDGPDHWPFLEGNVDLSKKRSLSSEERTMSGYWVIAAVILVAGGLLWWRQTKSESRAKTPPPGHRVDRGVFGEAATAFEDVADMVVHPDPAPARRDR